MDGAERSRKPQSRRVTSVLPLHLVFFTDSSALYLVRMPPRRNIAVDSSDDADLSDRDDDLLDLGEGTNGDGFDSDNLDDDDENIRRSAAGTRDKGKGKEIIGGKKNKKDVSPRDSADV